MNQSQHEHGSPEVSVLIPTRGRADKVAACVAALGNQSLDPDRYEVLVGLDGPDPESERAITRAWTGPSDRLVVRAFERSWQAVVRNGLLEEVRGSTIVFLNDDVIPDPDLLRAHVKAQHEAWREGGAAIVVGDSPWVVHEPDRLFDRLIRETSMVFFYDRMNEPGARADRWRDWGFRHAWMLNLSVPVALVREAGGIGTFEGGYGYEDDELAWRLGRRFGTPVLYRPEAKVAHDHRMDPGDYLGREFRLGYSAWGFAASAPDCARAMFGCDVRSDERIDYWRRFVEHEEATARRLVEAFLGLADLPASCVGGADAPQVIGLIYQQHLLLKRWVWRRGLLAAADGVAWQDGQATLLAA